MTPEHERLVEAVARAMCDAGIWFGIFDSAEPQIREQWRRHARVALGAIRETGLVIAPRKTLTEAHAAMRECGWHLAPASEGAGDGVLEAACAEIEDRFAQLLAASPIASNKEGA